MKRLGRRIACLAGLLLTAAVVAPATAEASTNLYHCSPPGSGFIYACTTVTSAPSTGIHVLDRTTGTVLTWYNGTNVALYSWAVDTGSSCGVNGDQYVWAVQWSMSGTLHWAVLGDWWLSTGSYSDWSGYTDGWGTLGDSLHNEGSGSGTCNVFNPSGGWTLA